MSNQGLLPVPPSGNFSTDFLSRSVRQNEIVVTGVDVNLNDLIFDPAKDVYVFADTLSLNGSFTMPGRRVFLHCRRFLVEDATIDVSGVAGQVRVTNRTLDGQRPGDGGSPGTERDSGKNSGNLTIFAGQFAVKGAQLSLKANGGAGGRGQDGGNGAPGSGGPTGGNHTSQNDCRNGDNGGNGQPGGDGGQGADGGDGGNAGQIQVSTLSDPPRINIEARGGSGGAAGRGGASGAGGAGGSGGSGGHMSSLRTSPNIVDVSSRAFPVGAPLALTSANITTFQDHGHGQREIHRCEGGQGGSVGQRGGDGRPGANGTQGRPGTSIYAKQEPPDYKTAVQQIDFDAFSQHASVSQALMLFHKVSQLYLESSTNSRTSHDATAVLLGWLEQSSRKDQGAFSKCDLEVPPTSQEVRAFHGRVVTLITQLDVGLDYFGFSPNFVPSLQFDSYRDSVKDILHLLAQAERTKTLYDAQLDNQLAATNAVSDAIQITSESLISKKKQRDALESQMNRQQDDIAELSKSLAAQKKALEQANAAFKNAISTKTLGCDLPGVLTFVASVASVVDGKYDSALAAIAAMRDVSTATGAVQNSISKMAAADGQLSSAKHAFNEIKAAAEADSANAKILMRESDLESLLRPYLDMPEAQTLKDQLEDFVELAKARNQSVLAYTSLVSQHSSCEAEIAQRSEEIGRLQSLVAFNNPTVATFSSCLSKLVLEEKRTVVQLIYSELRALNYWSLQLNDVIINDLSSETLGRAHVHILGDQINEREMKARALATMSPIDVSLSDASPSFSKEFEKFRTGGTFTFALPPDRSEFQIGIREVVINGIWVEIPGIAQTTDGFVTINVRQNGTSTFVRADDGQKVVFQHRPRPTEVRYLISNPSSSLVENEVKKNLGGSDGYAYVSPFAAWTISILKDNNRGTMPDLSRVKSINVRFWGFYQPTP